MFSTSVGLRSARDFAIQISFQMMLICWFGDPFLIITTQRKEERSMYLGIYLPFLQLRMHFIISLEFQYPNQFKSIHTKSLTLSYITLLSGIWVLMINISKHIFLVYEVILQFFLLLFGSHNHLTDWAWLVYYYSPYVINEIAKA